MAAFLLALLLVASGHATAGDELPHLQLPGTTDASRGGESDAPPLQAQLMDIMSTSGCGRFAALVAATPNVSDVFQEHLVACGGGLTVFCPDDKAVAAFEPTFRALANSDRLDVLLHHAAGERYARAQLAASDWVAVRTLAAVADAAHTVFVRDRGKNVKLWLGPTTWPQDGLGLARVTNTVSSEEAPLVLYVVDAVLLRQKLDGGEEAPVRCGYHDWGCPQWRMWLWLVANACWTLALVLD